MFSRAVPQALEMEVSYIKQLFLSLSLLEGFLIGNLVRKIPFGRLIYDVCFYGFLTRS